MKILYVTTIGGTMTFFQSFIRELLDEGHQVDIATNDSLRKVPDCYEQWGCRIFSLSCSRSPFDKGNFDSIKQIRELAEREQYDIVHCHTPIAAACTRIACRKLRENLGLKVLYTAHGFHFYKGAPLKNWLIYYPVEKLCAHYTDKLITINSEDYLLAKNRIKAKEVLYVPGVGVDLSEFRDVTIDRLKKRSDLGITENETVLFSVGELNENKNHQLFIRALAKLGRDDVHYMIAGRGPKAEELEQLAETLGVGRQVHLLGYRDDICELLKSVDCFCFPSYREGLSVSLIESMACGLPVLCSRIRGNTDLIKPDGGILFNPHSVDECYQGIVDMLNNDMQYMGEVNRRRADNYSIEKIIASMKAVYEI